MEKKKSEMVTVCGLWKRTTKIRAPGDEFNYLKTGSLDTRALENIQRFGEKTILIVVKTKRKKGPNSPDYLLMAAPSWDKGPQKEIFWEDLQKND